MSLLDALSLACTLPDIENIWTLQLADAFANSPAVTAWRVRWLFPEAANLAFSVTSPSNATAIDRFFTDRILDASDSVLAFEHPQLPAGLYVAGRNPGDLRRALDAVCAKYEIMRGLITSFHLLRASFAAQTAQAFLQSELPVLIIGPDSVLYKHTPLATLLLSAEDSEIFIDANRQLAFKSTDTKAIFSSALATAFTRHRIPHKIRCGGYSMTFTAPSPSAGPAMASVVLRKPDTPIRVDVRELQSHFELTLSQARLAKALIGGESPEQYASRVGISRKGVKWHLHPLMKALNVETRDQLVFKLVRWAG